MEPESTVVKTTELNDDMPPPKRSKNCFVAWSAVGLLLATWLCFFAALAFFWKKNNDLQHTSAVNLTQVQTQLAQNQKNLTQVQEIIQKNFSSDNNLIRLKEARELVQLANYNLFYLRDPNGALSALTLANKQLTEFSNTPAVLEPLRNLLNENIAKLKALPHVNLNDALAQLHSLQAQIEKLPLVSTTPANKELNTTSQESTSDKKWVNAFKNSLLSFQQLIVVRHLDKPIEPLLPEIQQQYLQQNLQLLLQQAQWALLHNQQAIYESSLQQVKQAIQRYFVEKSQATETIVQQINELEKLNLQVALPDLNPTLESIDSLIKTVANKPTDQKETPL